MEKIIAKTILNVKLLKSILRYKNLPFEVFQLNSKANCETRMKWGFFQFFEFIRKIKIFNELSMIST